MNNIIRAVFQPGDDTTKAYGLYQWSYGQKLEIHGLDLPRAVEVHFAAVDGTEATVRIGTTVDKVTTVPIPDVLFEQEMDIKAYVYLSDSQSGETIKTVNMPMTPRQKPEGWHGSEETTMGAIMDAINQFADGKADGLDYKDNILKLLSGEKELARVTIAGGTGGAAREIELQKSETAIQWRHTGEEEWRDLVLLEELRGEPGADGKTAYQYAQDGGYSGTEEEFAEKLAAVSRQVQPDWNQNDETSVDYIKNRPFYEDLVQTELFDICALADAVGTSWVQVDEKAYAVGLDVDDSKPIFIDTPIVVGNEYIIAYNGALYKCIAKDGSFIGEEPDFIFIGDINDNNEPTNAEILLAPHKYFDGSDISGYVLVNAYSPGDTVPTELKVIANIEKIMKLDEKYLPEGCLQQSDYSQFDETASDYIKNRPFYDDVFNKTLTFTNVGTSSQSMVFLGNDLQLIDGETYTVTVNDESFSTEAVSYNDDGTSIYLHYHTNSSKFNNVIQCRLDGENSQYYAFSWWSSGSTVSISGKFKRFKQIDNKYLNVVTSIDGQTGDVLLKNTSVITCENTVVDGTYPRRLIKAVNGSNPYALDLGSTVLLGHIDGEKKFAIFSEPCILRELQDPIYGYDAATKDYVDKAIVSAKQEIMLNSSTEGSTKVFKITVDDSGVITATEVTE